MEGNETEGVTTLTDRELLELILSQVNALQKTQNESHEAHALLAQEFHAACEMVKKHDIDIGGNGKPGLQAEMIQLRAEVKGIRDVFGKFIWPAVGAGMIMVTNSFLDLLVY